MKKNILVIIGWRGAKSCFLNVSKNKAIENYCKAASLEKDLFFELEVPIEIIEFDSVFNAYEVWEN